MEGVGNNYLISRSRKLLRWNPLGKRGGRERERVIHAELSWRVRGGEGGTQKKEGGTHCVLKRLKCMLPQLMYYNDVYMQ